MKLYIKLFKLKKKSQFKPILKKTLQGSTGSCPILILWNFNNIAESPLNHNAHMVLLIPPFSYSPSGYAAKASKLCFRSFHFQQSDL